MERMITLWHCVAEKASPSLTGKPPRSAWAISALAFGAAILAAEAAFAFEGRYAAGDKSYRQELTIAKRADGRFNVTAVVGTEGCSGIIDNAVGAADGDMLKAEGKEGDETCVLVLRRTKQGVSLDEEDGCIDFHGPSCEFSGDYRKRR
ncbi:MAG TPA: hypothetical protein VFE63_11630 [Roseiarcus sp.]|jgi:hypothetical protein|nr:hypothetical protein [Roseiarcus sp.]